MKVWVVLEGMYSDQTVMAVFSTAEQALSAYPDGEWVAGNSDAGDPDWISKAGLSDYHAITRYIIDEPSDVRQAREREDWLRKHPEFRK